MELLIATDGNAHSPSWGGDRLDSRGKQLEEFIHEHQLWLLNDSKHPTFSGRGQTFIDLTLVSYNLHSLISNWKCGAH
jgi:hypothetical protein